MMTEENEQEVRLDVMGWFFAIVGSLFVGVVLTIVLIELLYNMNASPTQDGSESWGADDFLLMMVTFAPLVAMVLVRKRIGWLRRSLYKPVG